MLLLTATPIAGVAISVALSDSQRDRLHTVIRRRCFVLLVVSFTLGLT